jgi:hypothetical protein
MNDSDWSEQSHLPTKFSMYDSDWSEESRLSISVPIEVAIVAELHHFDVAPTKALSQKMMA